MPSQAEIWHMHQAQQAARIAAEETHRQNWLLLCGGADRTTVCDVRVALNEAT